MSKENVKRLLAVLLCMVLIGNNVMSTDIFVNAAEVESLEMSIDGNDGAEGLVDVAGGDIALDVVENGRTQEEDINAVDDEGSFGDAEEMLALMTSEDDIASGFVDEDYGQIAWVIDANGKLMVTGTGDFSNVVEYDGRAPWHNNSKSIISAQINVTSMTDSSYMFYSCENLTNVDIANFDTSNVTNMDYMFSNCLKLENLDLSSFDTSNVVHMNRMFSGCIKLTNLDVSNFDTGNVEYMNYMFSGCSNLQNLDVSSFNTSNVEYMNYMFSGCRNLRNLDVRKFNTSNVKRMTGLFYECESLISLDVSGFDTRNVTSMSYMFEGCENLIDLDVGNFDTRNVESMSCMFEGCESLTSLELSNFDTRNVTDMGGMFNLCLSLLKLDVNSFDTTNVYSMDMMFTNCRSLTSLDLSNFNIENVLYMQSMFSYCESLTDLDLSSFDASNIKTMDAMHAFFTGCTNLAKISTPYNLTYSVSLPKSQSTDTWYCADGTTVTELPQNLSYSVALGKNDIPEELQLSGVSKDVFWEIDRYGTLTLTGSGDWIRDADGLGPWCNYPERIKKAVIRLTDTTNADSMFFGCENLKNANLCGLDMNQIVSASDMFSGCTALDTIYTPLNLSVSVPLPTNTDTDIWYCSDGTVVTELPKNLDYNMIFGKKYIPDDFPKSITECTGGTINGKGRSYGRVSIVDIGEFVKNKQVRWKFDANSTEYQLAKTDENGYFMLESPLLSYDANGSNDYTFKTTVAYFTGKTWVTVPREYTMEVKVEPLTVSQKWQLKTEGSFEMGIGASVGGEVGPAKVKASFGEVGTAVSSGGTMSISHGYVNGKRKLTLLQTMSKDIASKASFGPAVSGSIGAVKGKVKLIGVKGEKTVGDSITYGLEIDDYNPADIGQLGDVAKFVVTAQMYNSENIMLRQILSLWGFENYNIKGAGIESCLSVGASSFGGGVSDSSGEEIGFSVDVNSTGYDRTYSTGFTENVDDKTTKYEAGIASDVKEGILNFGLDGNKNRIEGFSLGSFGSSVQNVDVSLKTDKDGKLTRAEYTNATYNSWGVPFYSNTETNEISFSVSDSDMLQRLESVNRLKYIISARNTTFFPESYITDLWGDICKNTETLEFEVTNKEKSMVKVPIAFGLNAVADIGAGVEIAGSNEIAYVTQTGFAEGDSLYVTAEMSNTQEDINNAKMDVSELLSAPLKAAGEKISEFLIDVTGKVADGVKSGLAWVGEKISDGTDWVLHVISVKNEGKSKTGAMANSYEICTYLTASTEKTEMSGTSMTVGDPYMVYVTDNMGNEVTDFTDHPLVLKLGYDDASLTAAGVTNDALSALGIYMYSEEKCGYIYLGGEIDTTNQQVMIDIIKPGQYILAADNLAPSIYDIYVSDTSPRPTITAFLSELSGFSQFSMEIDGVEYVNETALNKYLNQASGSFVYKIMEDLSVGEHTLSFTATDSRGNATKQPMTFVFVVDSESNYSEFFEVTFDMQGHGVALEEYQTYKNILAGSKITEPQKPQADGYVFLGWYKDATCIELWDFSSDIVDKNITLYAAWKETGSEEEDAENQGDGLWVSGISKSGYLYTGDAIKPSIKVYDKKNLLTEKVDYTISYKNNTKAGKATITVTGKGNYSGKETVTFSILPIDLKDISVIAEDMTVAYNNKLQKKVPTLTYNGKKLSNNKDFTVSYPALEQGVSDAYKAVGTYNILLTAKEGGNFTGTRTVKLTITDSILISKAKVSKIPDQPYTGNAIEPRPTVTCDNNALKLGTDYTVTYANNTEVGTATAILTGIGDYAGTKKVTFKIAGISLKKAVVTGIEDKVYNGSEQKPNITVTLNNTVLAEGSDYKLTYAGGQNAGKASVTIKGINAYTGTFKKSFKIIAYDLQGSQISGLANNITAKYVKGGSKPEVGLTFAGKKLTEGTDYTVSYRNNKAVTTGETQKLPTLTIKGKGNFKGTLSKTFTITSKALDDADSPVTLSVADKGFVDQAGKYISNPILTDSDGKKLIAGKDYEKEISYSLKDGTPLTGESIVNVGSIVKVRVTGKGVYYGELEKTYRITEFDFSKAKIKIAPKVYTGSPITLDKNDISVTIGGTSLIYGTDYEIIEDSYANNKNKGSAKVIIIGKGKYGGMKTSKFKITTKGFLWFWRKF